MRLFLFHYNRKNLPNYIGFKARTCCCDSVNNFNYEHYTCSAKRIKRRKENLFAAHTTCLPMGVTIRSDESYAWHNVILQAFFIQVIQTVHNPSTHKH